MQYNPLQFKAEGIFQIKNNLNLNLYIYIYIYSMHGKNMCR
jgi:hypothetical protein